MGIFKKNKQPAAIPRSPKILVLRFSSIGDIVLTSPVLRCIKTQRPECTLHYLTKKTFEPLLTANPYVDKILTISENVLEILPQLKAENYTCIVDLHHNLRTARIKQALSTIPAYTLNKKNIGKWLYVNFKINLLPEESIVVRNMAVVKPLQVINDGKGLDFFIPDQDRVTNEDLPVSHWAGFIACVIGGTYATKRLPIVKWKEFCALSPYPIILLGSKEDREMGTAITAEDNIKIYNACGKFNFNESADIIARAQVVVSHDTGLMHVAAAFQKPIISIWGNTTPELGMFPYYGFNDWGNKKAPQNLAAEIKGLNCRPCSKIGFEKCPRGHFKCMHQQNVEEMIVWVKKYWKTQR